MRVEMMNRLDSRVARRLMPPHRVRKGNAKKVVVTRRGFPEDPGETAPFAHPKIGERRTMLFAEQQCLEGPDSPKWHKHGKVLVVADNAFL